VVSGTVAYGNARAPGPLTRYVPNVLISAAGSPVVSDTTGSLGTYSLTGFGSGAYTITPFKTGGQNGAVSAFDAALVQQYVVGNSILDTTQQIVGDVSGAGGLSSYDAALIANFAVAGPVIGNAGAWRFSPASRNYPSITSDIPGEDYVALLIGDVSGNWGDPSPFRPARNAAGPERAALMNVPNMVTAADGEIVIPVNVQGIANKGVISYELDLRYDPAVIQPQARPVAVMQTVSSGLSVATNTDVPGLLKVVAYGAMQISGNGILLNLRFTAIGAPGTTSPLTFERMMLNEGDPRILAVDGQVELSSSTTQAEIRGRVLTAMGQGVANTRVTLTDSAGQSRTILSNGSGLYRFGGLQIGQTYTIIAATRTLHFGPLTVGVTGQLVAVELVSKE
jgi:hypothetical protein